MCVIVAHPTQEGVFLYKSRDRNYVSEIAVVHTILQDTEVVFMFDMQTGWVEGLNEYGIGFINSTLSVIDDEDEINKVVGNKKPELSLAGRKALEALSLDTIKKVAEHLTNTTFYGHSFISDGRDLIVIEQTVEHLAKENTYAYLNKTTVRTNHGILYPGTGYKEGVDRLSSASRLYETLKAMGGVDDGHSIAEALRAIESPLGAYYNPLRTDSTKDMLTRTQLTLDLNGLIFKLGWIPKISKFSGILKKLPKGYEPKIKIEIEKITNFPK